MCSTMHRTLKDTAGHHTLGRSATTPNTSSSTWKHPLGHHAFNVQQIKWVQDANQARPVRDGVAAGGGSAGTYNPVGCYAQVYHLEGRSMKLNIPTQRNLSGGVVKCFNCLAQGHRVKDCTIPFGPHRTKTLCCSEDCKRRSKGRQQRDQVKQCTMMANMPPRD